MNTLSSKRLDAKRHYVILAKALDGICQLVMPVQSCMDMTNWPNTIQCLGSDQVISVLGVESSATRMLGSTDANESAERLP